MARQSVTRCKECPATIRFLRMPSGKWLPIDVNPDPSGNVIVTNQDLDHGRVLDKNEGHVGNRFVPHWRSCTNAGAFRGKRKPA